MLILAIACLLLAALPVALGLCNLALYRRPDRATGCPEISVLIPARNEESNIGDAVAAILASEGVALDLIVLDDASTDRTVEILSACADHRLRVATAPPLPGGWSGKQHACARLAELARHELMVFVDADVRLSPDALSRMAGFMQRNTVGLASGFPRQVTRSWAERLALPLMHFLLLGYLPIWRMQRDPSPALGAGCGQLFIARRAEYRRAGGHAAIRASLHDGITLPRAFRRAGIMTGLFDSSRFARCRMYGSAAEVWSGLSKNATEGIARPVALPIWTVLLGAQILPLALLSTGPLAWCALLLPIAFRLLLAARFRQSWAGALLHPLGLAFFLVLQWVALMRAAAGHRPRWRGRAYPAQ